MSPDFGLEIDGNKLAMYLLNPNHPKGGSKAKFFLGHGFSVDEALELAGSLAAHGFIGWPGQEKPGYHGRKHVIYGPLTTPNGTNPFVCSVWELDEGETMARFITAYPA